MSAKSIIDLPNEIIEKLLTVYLSSNDVCSFGMTGVKHFKQIAENVLENRSKSTSHVISNNDVLPIKMHPISSNIRSYIYISGFMRNGKSLPGRIFNCPDLRDEDWRLYVKVCHFDITTNTYKARN